MLAQLVRRRSPTEWAVTLRGEDLYIGECTINRVVDGYLGSSAISSCGSIGERAMRRRRHRPFWITRPANCGWAGCAPASTRPTPVRSGWPSGWALSGSPFLPEADFGGRVADMYYYARKLPGRSGRWCRDPRPRGRGRHQCLRIVHGFLRRDVEKPFRGMVY